MADLANVRNAARDMARDLARFERDFERFQRCAGEARAAADLTRTVNEAVAGHPDLARNLAAFADKLGARGEADRALR